MRENTRTFVLLACSRSATCCSHGESLASGKINTASQAKTLPRTIDRHTLLALIYFHVRLLTPFGAALLHVQVRVRKTAVGTSVSHSEKQSTGRVYVRSILIELGKPDDFITWVKDLVARGRVETGGMYAGIDEVLRKLKEKVEKGESWKLPESRYGSVHRPIAKTHPKEITMALRAAIDKESGYKLDKGHFGRYSAYSEVEKLLEKKRTDALVALGKEADQRRMLVLYDNEQLDLFESILTCAVNAAQTAGDMKGPPRNAIDTLTVGVIVSAYFSLGKRGVNLDDLVHGYMTVGAWNAKVWESTSPLTLDIVTAGKGDGSTKKQDQLLHHRDPMRCPIAMMGLYFGTHTCNPRNSQASHLTLVSSTRVCRSIPVLSAARGVTDCRNMAF